MARTTMRVLTDKTKDLAEALTSLTTQAVYVGIPDSRNEREDGDPASNSDIGYWMEFGVPEKNIPARPALLPGVQNAQEEISKRLRDAGKAALNGRPSSVTANFAAAGLAGQLAVQDKITTGPFAALADSTIAARRRRGKMSVKPLIDTGQYRRAFTYVIRKRKNVDADFRRS